MTERFPQYTVDYISGIMSLRKPQEESLKILDAVMSGVSVRKGADLEAALGRVHAMYPICTDFEREFVSLTFALATGVGKTRLMGAFVTYLYTNYGIRNFFVVAPNMTIYDKLRRDLGDPGNPKYVFRGLGCFAAPPQIFTEDDYKSKQLSVFDSDIRIFTYNIDKFNKENASMRRINETIGDSFYQYLTSLKDLVLIMDESHHYRAKKGAAALNDLRPMLGLELTATPLVTSGSRQVPFKNVVYEYPLSRAISDGYTRTPFALTRSDIDFYNFGEEQMDKMMLLDGIACHERTKRRLRAFAENHEGRRLVKPFMLVVCKDTAHAQWVERFVRSDEFREGRYRNKTIIIHSRQKGAETEANTKMLLGVEDAANPVEVVIHVNMLKEGWDVNNLYTIVPLRTAASKVLREQMVGRGLRLPYGERTGDRDVDAVTLTAHDKFEDIIAEAQKGDSIFKAGNVIRAEEVEEEEETVTQMTLDLAPDETLEQAYRELGILRTEAADALIDKAREIVRKGVSDAIQHSESHAVSEADAAGIARKAAKAIKEDKDLGEVYERNANPLSAWMDALARDTYRKAKEKFIPIPKIKVTDEGVEEYVFVDFELDTEPFRHVPIQNEILIQNLEDFSDRQRIRGDEIDFEGYNPKAAILEELGRRPEIDYDKCSPLLDSLISRLTAYYEKLYGHHGMRNIVMMYKKDIAGKIYDQMMRHFYCENGFLREEVIGTRDYNMEQTYFYVEKVGLYDSFAHNIQSVLFTGIRKGVFAQAKFDSKEGELRLAWLLEADPDVLNWLRPHPYEFRITYNHGKRYEPDFVVETEAVIYLVEVKGRNMLTDPDVIAKKKRAVQYCEAASRWGRANGYKDWAYLFIPADEIKMSSSFMTLAERFREL